MITLTRWFALAGLSLAAVGSTAVEAADSSPDTATSVGHTRWTTYLRAGPGLFYSVLDELQPTTPLPGARCGEGWCRITVSARRFGYVSEADLDLAPNPSTQRPATGGACFEAGLSGYHGAADPVEFCRHPSQPSSDAR